MDLRKQVEKRYQTIQDRLAEIDAKAGTTDKAVRSHLTNFQDLPSAYTPGDVLGDIKNAYEFSEQRRGVRSAASSEGDALLQLLAQLDQVEETKRQQERENAFREREVSLKEREAAKKPETSLEEMLKIRKSLKDAGLDTAAVDKELAALGIDPSVEKSETITKVLSLIDQILKRNTKPITGVLQLESLIPGSDAQLTASLFDQLKGTLSLDNRSLLKGTGQISDYESKLLEKAASALNRKLSDTDFRKELDKLKKELGGTSAKTKVGGYVIEEVR